MRRWSGIVLYCIVSYHAVLRPIVSWHICLIKPEIQAEVCAHLGSTCENFLNKLCLNEPSESNTLIIHRSRISPLIGTNFIISLHHSSFDIVLRGINKAWACFFGYNASRYSGRGCRQEIECVYPLKYLGAGVEQLLTCLLCVCVRMSIT